ncbi:hypothetical protein ACFQX8_27505 [Klenkia terrae]|uniref:hypothetical protein n=1 Tax=Klenkia terrae TaxID=1052259 RepID=UPI003620077E
MTRDDLTAVMVLEEELFAPDTWTRSMYLEELSMTDTRSYTVAVDGDEVVGYAGLIAYPDEAHVATIGVTGSRQGRASAAACWTRCWPRPTGAAPSSCSRCGPPTRPPRACTPAAASCRSGCGRTTTRSAGRTHW